MQDVHILFQVGQRGHQRIAAPVRAGCRDDVIGAACGQNAAAAAVLAFAGGGEGHIFFNVLPNGAHADLIAQIADGHIGHAAGAQFVPQHIAFGFQCGHILAHRIVVNTLGVAAAGFHRDHRCW